MAAMHNAVARPDRGEWRPAGATLRFSDFGSAAMVVGRCALSVARPDRGVCVFKPVIERIQTGGQAAMVYRTTYAERKGTKA